RRHTRFSRDWSSDVCSSDLVEYGITQDEVDEFSVLSQRRWAEAQAAGRFADELVPMELPGKKGQTIRFERDEHPRPDTTREALRSEERRVGKERSCGAAPER